MVLGAQVVLYTTIKSQKCTDYYNSIPHPSTVGESHSSSQYSSVILELHPTLEGHQPQCYFQTSSSVVNKTSASPFTIVQVHTSAVSIQSCYIVNYPTKSFIVLKVTVQGQQLYCDSLNMITIIVTIHKYV